MTGAGLAGVTRLLSVSVVLGTYNGERSVEAQLRSLLRQTLPPCELVVSDDRSSDRTVAIVESVAVSSTGPVRISVTHARWVSPRTSWSRCRELRAS